MNPRTEALLNRWLDGELEPAEAAAVQRMMLEDPEVRQAYYGLLALDRLLNDRFAGEEKPVLAVPRAFPRAWQWGLAAAVLLTLFSGWLAFSPHRQNPAAEPVADRGPTITGSTDSRMTIAQRQDKPRWEVGEMLRLERGTAVLQLSAAATANVEGPAAIELVDASGNIRLLEGMASFAVGEAAGSLDVHVPGGILRTHDAQFTSEVFPDGIANVRVESGFLEIRPRRGGEAVYLKPDEAVRLEKDGTSVAIRLPNQHFRAGLPQQVVLFEDDFRADAALPLKRHRPLAGPPWQVLAEDNTTLVRNGVLDTSTGARRLLAPLSPHDAAGTRAVYIVTFQFVPPTMIDDKLDRKGGEETISLVDAAGREILSVFAQASHGHRWQLRDDFSMAVTALTPVCALWTHSLTLCYGMDGRATLHDGATAQAPVIAELHIAAPSAVSALQISNRDGGDLAFTRIQTAFLPPPPTGP